MMDRSLPFGKFAGGDLDDLTDSEIEAEYESWSCSYQKSNHRFYQTLESEHFRRRRKSQSLVPREATAETPRIPRGKHRGKRLKEVTDHVLLCMQGAWNSNEKLRRNPFFKHIQNEVARRGHRVLGRHDVSGAVQRLEKELKGKYGGQIPVAISQALGILKGSCDQSRAEGSQ